MYGMPHPLLEMPGILWVEMWGPALGDYCPGRGCWEYPEKQDNTASHKYGFHAAEDQGPIQSVPALLGLGDGSLFTSGYNWLQLNILIIHQWASAP